MTENKEIKKGKKTLSLKLGSKPIISNKRGIEAGKTVIVEKKRYKRNTNTCLLYTSDAADEGLGVLRRQRPLFYFDLHLKLL